MPLDPDTLLNWPFPAVEHRYTERDTILYALGVGAGHDPLDPGDLRHVYEDGLLALPSMAVVLGHPGFWLKHPGTGIDWRQTLHGEQGLVLHGKLPVAGTVVGRTRITGLVDKGPGKAALLFSERTVTEQASGELLCTVTSTTFLRGEGGFGGAAGPVPAPHPMPEGEPERTVDLPTLPQAALIYRLSGDDNPLHADPAIAAAAGFPRPILHGLATYGVAGRAVLRACCGGDPTRLKRLDVRFSAPVFPGETIHTEIWGDGPVVSFRCRVVERDVVVLSNGLAEVGG